MASSLFGVRGESTYFGPLAITIRLRTPRRWTRVLGQRRKLVKGAIPLDFLVELLAGGGGADT